MTGINKVSSLRVRSEKNTTFALSRYFPEGTEYFYGYPTGEDSNFYNDVPPIIEELVSARPLSAAGEGVRVILFANAAQHEQIQLLRALGVPLVPDQQMILLPADIDATLIGVERNEAVKAALRKRVTPGKLIMAQPYLDSELADLYQIPPALSVWLNDKKNMPSYISAYYLPKRYASFMNGEEFFHTTADLPVPCVIKISSSSSGDGVRLCMTPEDLAAAKNDMRGTHVSIIAEQFIRAKKNLGVQFGIPYDRSMPVEFVGVNEQITTPAGSFLGGIIHPQAQYPRFEHLLHLLRERILPYARDLGWYGPGGFDVLLGDDDRYYFVDANFRMTGMTTFLYAAANSNDARIRLGFNGTLSCSEASLYQKLLPLAHVGGRRQIFQTISLIRSGHDWRLSGFVFGKDFAELIANVQALLDIGFISKALSACVAQQLRTE